MKRLLIPSILLLFCTLNSFAQNGKGPLSVVSPDSLNVVLKNYLEQTSGKRFEDPSLPRFLISDRKDIFVFGVGGYVGAKTFYDYQGNSGNDFLAMDTEKTSKQNDVVNLSLSSSRFFFKILGNTKAGIVEAYLESGFSGAKNALELKKAYINILGFRVGKSTTAFADNQTFPIIGDGAVYSFEDRSVPMINYSYRFKSGIRLQGGAEFPQSTSIYTSEAMLNERKVVTVEMPVPDFTFSAFLDRKNLHLHAGAILRVMQFYDQYDKEKFINTPGYAFNLSGNYTIKSSEKVSHKIFLQGQYEYMMADSFGNLKGKGLSAIMPNRLGWKSFDLTSGVGGQAGYSLIIGQNAVNIQYNANKIFGHEKSGFSDLYKTGFVTTANYMRKFLSYGTIGGELEYGQNETVGGKKLSDFRFVAILRYDF